MTTIRKVRFCYYMSGRSNGILAARRSIGNSNKVWAGTQIIKPISSPHTHWLGLSVEIIAGPLKMQLLTLPARLLHWLFLIALSEGAGRAFWLEAWGKHLELSGKELPKADGGLWWFSKPPLLWKRCHGGLVINSFSSLSEKILSHC